MKTKYYCTVSKQEIPPERVEALRILEVPEDEWTLKEYSQCRKKKGIWMGDVGRSELKIVTKIESGSVRDMCHNDSPDPEDYELPDGKGDA